MKPENFRCWMKHIRLLSDVIVSRNWYKTVSFYTKIHIYAFLYKCYSIKQFIFNKYETNLKTISSHRTLIISGFLLLKFLKFDFAFLIDIIDNIITYNPYSLYYVTRTSANGSAVSLSRDTDGNHVTSKSL